MKGKQGNELERQLSALYRSDRKSFLSEQGPVGRAECIKACLSACEVERCLDSDVISPHMQLRGFLYSQVRFTPRVVWIAFVLIAWLAVAAVRVESEAMLSSQVLSASGGLMALICLVSVTRSKPFDMGELEASCPFNAVSVVFARLVLLGLASAAVIAMASVVSGLEGVGAVRALLLMGAPYLIACAGGLMCARRVSSSDARGAAIAWAFAVAAMGAMIFYAAPSAYEQTSTWIWALSCAASGAWFFHELRAWIESCSTGFVSEPRTTIICH